MTCRPHSQFQAPFATSNPRANAARLHGCRLPLPHTRGHLSLLHDSFRHHYGSSTAQIHASGSNLTRTVPRTLCWILDPRSDVVAFHLGIHVPHVARFFPQ